MQFSNSKPNLQKSVQEIIAKEPKISAIVQKIVENKGRALLVGGAVRDLYLGVPVKDLDIEVYGISLSQLEHILRNFGVVSAVGKSFGVLRLHHLDIDWSLPRADSSGRRPQVVVDEHMSFEQAFKRRDLTMNAMGIDLTTYELIDPYHGLRDVRDKKLRATDLRLFVEDPLRFYRVMQFIGRFEMTPDVELNHLCSAMDLSGVSLERIEGEFEKLLLKSRRPSLGLRWMKSIGRLAELLPELAATVGVPQDARWHPEGDVFEHSMQALDAAAMLDYDNKEQKIMVMMAALCHDCGKATTTQIGHEGITCYGHDVEGEKLCLSFLKRITRKNTMLETVPKLVRYHMQPVHFVRGNAKPSAYKRLARKLAPHATLTMLALLALADARGCNSQGHEPLTIQDQEIEAFVRAAHDAQVEHRPEEPVLKGRDLLGHVEPGPRMGALLQEAYEIQLEEGIVDKDVLKQRVVGLKK